MSVFLQRPESDHLAANAFAFAIFDGFPVSPGHTLVVPRRVVASWFEATREEQHALLALMDDVKALLDVRFAPDGYNIGINAGRPPGRPSCISMSTSSRDTAATSRTRAAASATSCRAKETISPPLRNRRVDASVGRTEG